VTANWLVRRVMGCKLSRSAFDAALETLVSHRASTFQRNSTTGHGGWYRRLGEAGRLGYVATAQMTIFANAVSPNEDQLDKSMKFLLDSQNPDGGWPFVTNTVGQSVLDATAWALIALSKLSSRPSFAVHHGAIGTAVARGSQFIRDSELPSGGWGIIRGSHWRAFSTAMALRALISAGANATDIAADSSARSLVSNIDPNTGAWSDSKQNLSIAITSTAILALSELNALGGSFEAPIRRARKWLLLVREPDSWGERSRFGTHEEVEFSNAAGAQARIEYHFSRRPHAIAALCSADLRPEVCDALTYILQGAEDPRDWCGCGQQSWTSWIVFDSWYALDRAQSRLPPDWVEVWWTPSRVVVSVQGERWLRKMFRRYWPHLVVLAIAAGTAWGAVAAELVDGFGWQTLTFVLTTTALSVFANAISAGILDWRESKK